MTQPKQACMHQIFWIKTTTESWWLQEVRGQSEWPKKHPHHFIYEWRKIDSYIGRLPIYFLHIWVYSVRVCWGLRGLWLLDPRCKKLLGAFVIYRLKCFAENFVTYYLFETLIPFIECSGCLIDWLILKLYFSEVYLWSAGIFEALRVYFSLSERYTCVCLALQGYDLESQ